MVVDPVAWLGVSATCDIVFLLFLGEGIMWDTCQPDVMIERVSAALRVD
jgi:hypothetical protein